MPHFRAQPSVNRLVLLRASGPKFDLLVVVVQSLSCVQLFATQCTAAHQASLFITNSQGLLRLTSMESMMPSYCPWTSTHQLPLSSTISQSLLKFVSIESVMLFNHLILCHLFLLLPSIFPSIRVFFKALYHRP